MDKNPILEMILDNGLGGAKPEKQLLCFAKAIAKEYPAIKRLALGMSTLHPQYGALTYVWKSQEQAVTNAPQSRSVLNSETFTNSPINHLLQTGSSDYRQRLDTGAELPFPILEEVRAEGMTEYAAHLIRFEDQQTNQNGLQGVFYSFATDDPEGFENSALEDVYTYLPHLTLALKSRLTFDVAKIVAETYLGKDAGKRVLTGQIVQGSTHSIHAVIWFCDLRGFTKHASRLEQEALIEILDEHLELLAGPVEANGGQILKFMGDGFLATFEVEEGNLSGVASTALAAARKLRQDFARTKSAWSAENKPVLDFGLSLHVGDVYYGNIGTDRRLDFTVVGPSVNLASRIQDLCRPLEQDILVSNAFREAIGVEEPGLVHAGTHELRGVSQRQEIYLLGK